VEYSQVARRSFLVRVFKGSNPFIPKTTWIFLNKIPAVPKFLSDKKNSSGKKKKKPRFRIRSKTLYLTSSQIPNYV
jgi:hypothetical protein